MSRNIFPDEPAAVLGVLLDLFRHQNQAGFVRVLENSSAAIEQTEYDNLDGGTYIYTLTLKLPIKLFASIESMVQELENGILEKCKAVFRDTGNQHLAAVVIVPDTAIAKAKAPHEAREDDVRRIWHERPFRLFLSHIAQFKVEVGQLKDDLDIFGVAAFVAHSDIEPGLEWQTEIEKALHSMHALAALLTPGFHDSRWTDQEVGVAIGRGTLIVPVRLGLDPYGFIGKQQGLPGDFGNVRGITSGLVDIILRNENTKKQMRDGLIYAFERAPSFVDAKALMSKIESLDYVSDEQLQRIEKTCEGNRQVKDAFGVPARVVALKQRFGATNEVPF